MKAATPFTAGLLFLLLAAGCHSSTVIVKGKITRGGQIVKQEKRKTLEVTFVPITEDGNPPQDSYLAWYNAEDGTFKVVGRGKKGIPKGKYRIAVEMVHNNSEQDTWKGEFGKDSSPIVREVDGKKSFFEIDLDHPRDE